MAQIHLIKHRRKMQDAEPQGDIFHISLQNGLLGGFCQLESNEIKQRIKQWEQNIYVFFTLTVLTHHGRENFSFGAYK